MAKLIYICIPMLFLFSCQNDTESKLTAKREMVMKVHDDAMIQNGTINKNKRLLKGVLSSVEEMSEQQEIVTSIKLLEDANRAMMEWMRSYKDPAQEVLFDDKMAYYDAAQKKMEEINIQITSALDQAQPIILKYQK